SNSPNVLLANSASGPFSQSITLALTHNSFSVPTFSVQGLASTGNATLTASAAGYTDGTTTINLTPSAIIWNAGDFADNLGNDVNLPLITIQLNPATLTFGSVQVLRAGLSLSITLNSSVPGVGTIASPISIAADAFSATALFHPVATGSTVLSFVTPTGFTT